MGKDKPIMFSGSMVRAILDGRKTQTRRVIKPQPVGSPAGLGCIGGRGIGHIFESEHTGGQIVRCPYGEPGDRLWVRETWADEPGGPDDYPITVYAADMAARHHNDVAHGPIFYLRSDYKPKRWRPSIYMPWWASRITLEVTGVRAERLRDISEADARAEGTTTNEIDLTHRESFQTLWDSINAKRGFGWEANPWVWAVEFKRDEG